MKYSLGRERIDTLPKHVVLEELYRVAKHYGFRRFSRHEFDAIAITCKGSTVIKNYGSWANALNSIGITLKQHKANRKQINDKDLFIELGRIWSNIGHRPSKAEWEASDAKYSYSTYKYRFGGWRNACAGFIDFFSGELPEEEIGRLEETIEKITVNTFLHPEKMRYIPLKVRLKVFQRDNFKCVFCGKSPATHPGSVLHVDHIKPFAKAGKTELNNLQTLCKECNWGKGGENA
jgi:hypothetical protein